MTTFASHPVPVAASLLDASSGALLVQAAPGAATTRASRALATDTGFREARLVNARGPRRAEVPLDQLTAPEAQALIDALRAARGGAGFIEWRHPDDEHPAATLWRALNPEAALDRDAGAGAHTAQSTLTFEEV